MLDYCWSTVCDAGPTLFQFLGQRRSMDSKNWEVCVAGVHFTAVSNYAVRGIYLFIRFYIHRYIQ